MEQLKNLVESRRFETIVIAIIVINAITLGLETVKPVMAAIGPALLTLDQAILVFFVFELIAKLAVYRTRFFHSPWRVFDFIIVAIALVPAAGPFSVLRALRILRVLRLISTLPSLRRVVGGLLAALPGMGSIFLLLMLVFYVFAVMATKLFGEAFPEWFGSIPASAYSLFQIMTLESWSMGIVRPVMEAFPWAWAFFIPFIASTTFTVLNLFIGVVVSAMQAEHDDQAADERETLHNDNEEILKELRALRAEVQNLRADRSGRAEVL
ncbi:MAG: ion transporter [Pseudomonadota bacterium]